MMTEFPTPTDWKSAAWWRNRSEQERQYHIKVPKRYTSLTGDLGDKAQEWVKGFDNGDSLFIYGPRQVGKTSTAVRVAQELVKRKALSARFVTAPSYVEMLKDQFGTDDNLLPQMYSSPYLVKYIQKVFDIVLLDELGQERETEFSNHEVGSLLRLRYEDVRTTIVASHLSPTEVLRRYGDRVSSVIEDMTVIRLS